MPHRGQLKAESVREEERMQEALLAAPKRRRYCRRCGAKMSIYHPGEECWPCLGKSKGMFGIKLP